MVFRAVLSDAARRAVLLPSLSSKASPMAACRGSRMTRIVRTTYRHKRPPSRTKPVALEVPDIATIRDRTRVASW
jgi:hypothetical protein